MENNNTLNPQNENQDFEREVKDLQRVIDENLNAVLEYKKLQPESNHNPVEAESDNSTETIESDNPFDDNPFGSDNEEYSFEVNEYDSKTDHVETFDEDEDDFEFDADQSTDKSPAVSQDEFDEFDDDFEFNHSIEKASDEDELDNLDDDEHEFEFEHNTDRLKEKQTLEDNKDIEEFNIEDIAEAINKKGMESVEKDIKPVKKRVKRKKLVQEKPTKIKKDVEKEKPNKKANNSKIEKAKARVESIKDAKERLTSIDKDDMAHEVELALKDWSKVRSVDDVKALPKKVKIISGSVVSSVLIFLILIF